MLDTGWMDRAACSGADPETFFPERAGSREEALAVALYCNGCPVRQECYGYAAAFEEFHHFGVYGGMGPHTRRTLRVLGSAAAGAQVVR